MIHVQFEHKGKIVNAVLSSCGLLCDTAECKKYETTSGGPYCNEFEIWLEYVGKKIQASLECQIEAQKRLKSDQINH